MNKKYYAKKRKIFNKQTNKVISCFTPVVIINKIEHYVSENGEIIEMDNKLDALKIAKETYFKFLESNGGEE